MPHRAISRITSLLQALCAADESSNILEDTCGIIFLGTPHQGSSLSILGVQLSRLTKRLGSEDTLLLNLRRNNSYLSDLEDRFRPLVKHKPVVSFYETKSTYLLGVSVGCVSVGPLSHRSCSYFQVDCR
jgi:hypothetical protein